MRIFRFGLYELDGATGDLRKDGKARPRLQGQPLEILLHLLDRSGEVVTREELRQRLWAAMRR
jgi:DNA-binding winged helix-turn-helix (wHTH) protein